MIRRVAASTALAVVPLQVTAVAVLLPDVAEKILALDLEPLLGGGHG